MTRANEPMIGDTLSWRMIDGSWCCGEIIGIEEDGRYLVRRHDYRGGTCLLQADDICGI